MKQKNMIHSSLLTGFLVLLGTSSSVLSKPVQSSTVEDAVSKAPIILLVETGKREFDDLKEGEKIKVKQVQFECRKQSYKVLKVYRNDSRMKVAVDSTIEVNDKSNGCMDFEMTLEKKQGKLVLRHTDPKQSAVNPWISDVAGPPVKEILFLTPYEWSGSPNPVFSHWGWFVSPHDYSAELEKKLPRPIIGSAGKRHVQLGTDCK